MNERDDLEGAGMMTKPLAHQASMPSAGIIVKFGCLAWMLGITFLYWLLSIPERMLVGSHLVILRWGREFLLQFFYRDYIF